MKDFKETTHKLGKSRIIKVGLIGLICLMSIQGAAFFLMYKAFQAIPEATELELQAVESYIAILGSINIVGAVGTIITAIIARYGFREMTGNMGAGMPVRNESDHGGI